MEKENNEKRKSRKVGDRRENKRKITNSRIKQKTRVK
jgi:hypothetical protein